MTLYIFQHWITQVLQDFQTLIVSFDETSKNYKADISGNQLICFIIVINRN